MKPYFLRAIDAFLIFFYTHAYNNQSVAMLAAVRMYPLSAPARVTKTNAPAYAATAALLKTVFIPN